MNWNEKNSISLYYNGIYSQFVKEPSTLVS
jgi:hypothetical protein